ncbi:MULTISPECIES: cysteine synthase A [unclassified Clostridium]|uniref:cysteine synthase A n=1 Tax=unclassified Clostridium TaxID=2614128 RepID=UPI00029869A5|nr:MULTISPECIES: cysteine synthase A [unclassified Clostridium]EKQ55512.1 MAG: cysteine synthase A [Clostridium sp. Maddingley MBC34-26]
MIKAAQSLTELIGKTPLLKPNKFINAEEILADIYFKLEYFNPAGSVKDRIAYAMILNAEEKGNLKPGTTIIEPSSGNTGVGIAFVAATRGYKVIIVMPDTMSLERRTLVSALGAQIILTPGADGMKGSIRKAEELHALIPNSVILQQFENEANPAIHKETTANEIWEDTNGNVDIFIAGVGTGGTVTGVGSALKEKKPGIQIIAVEPYDSPVLSGGIAGSHKIQGIGAGFIPKVYNDEIVDEIYKVRNDEAIDTSRELGRNEGLLVGISSGAAAFAARQVAKRSENKGKIIVTLLPDTGERYLSTNLYQYNK